MGEDDIKEIEDSDDNLIALSGKDTENITFRLIVLRAIEEARIQGSKEMTKGGEIDTILNGQKVKITIPDQRKKFKECVEVLHDLLAYYINDKDDEDFRQIRNNTEQDYENCYGNYLLIERQTNFLEHAKKTKKIPLSPEGKNLLDIYEDMVVYRYRQKYRKLISIFKKNKDLKSISEAKAY